MQLNIAEDHGIAKRTRSGKHVMYAIFFSFHGAAIQIPVPKCKTVNARFYQLKF